MEAKEFNATTEKATVHKRCTLGAPKIKTKGFIFNRDEANVRYCSCSACDILSTTANLLPRCVFSGMFSRSTIVIR